MLYTKVKFVMFLIIFVSFLACGRQANKLNEEGMKLTFGHQKYTLTGDSAGGYTESLNHTIIVVHGDSLSPVDRVEIDFAGNTVGRDKSTSLYIYFKSPEEKSYISMAGSGFLQDVKSIITSFDNYVEGSFNGAVEKLGPHGERTREVIKVSGVFKVRNIQKFKQ